jgi:hypothetical protein
MTKHELPATNDERLTLNEEDRCSRAAKAGCNQQLTVARRKLIIDPPSPRLRHDKQLSVESKACRRSAIAEL